MFVKSYQLSLPDVQLLVQLLAYVRLLVQLLAHGHLPSTKTYQFLKRIHQKRNPISPNIKMFHKTDSKNINLITLASCQTLIFFSAS